MLTGLTPPEETGPPPMGFSSPSELMRNTEIWLLPASTASRYLPSLETCRAPCEPTPAPVPAPPAANGEPRNGVNELSVCRSQAAIVCVPSVLSLTYRCPTTSDAADAPPAAIAAATAAGASRLIVRMIRVTKRMRFSFSLLCPSSRTQSRRDLAFVLLVAEQFVKCA